MICLKKRFFLFNRGVFPHKSFVPFVIVFCASYVFFGYVFSGFSGILGGSLFTIAPVWAAEERMEKRMEDHMAVAGHGHSHGGHAKTVGHHSHKAGDWMLSYRFMRMAKSGHRIGTDTVSPEYIVTNVTNWAGTPLRVVPESATMQKHVIGAMFSPTDRVTLMAMIPYIRKEMNLITFQGPRGTNRLGTFTVRSQGFGDPQISARTRLYSDAMHRLHLTMGLRLPVGSIDNRGTVLTPMNTRASMTLPYPMQIGSGSFGLLPGLSYAGNSGDISWGAQYMAAIQLNDNKRQYRLGDHHNLAAWGRIQVQDQLGFSLRARGWTQGRIKGRDRRINAPVQAADPRFQGGNHVDMTLGADFTFSSGFLRGNRLSSEFILPVYQNLNGPQIANDWAFVIGWQRHF